MKTSAEINELGTALNLAQSEIRSAEVNAVNPFLKNKYADLQSVTNAVKSSAAKNGLSYVQMPSTPPIEHGPNVVCLTTRLIHKSGQWLEDTVLIPVSNGKGLNGAQNYGVALAYARRYALAAMFGVTTGEDTDGATGDDDQKKTTPTQQETTTTKPVVSNASKRDAPTVKAALMELADGKDGNPSEGQLKYARASLSKLVSANASDAKSIIYFLFGKESSSDLTSGEASALIDWAGSNKDNNWTPDPNAITEAAQIVTAQNVANGQEPLFDDEPTGNNCDG